MVARLAARFDARRQQLHEVMDRSHAESERVKAENAVEDEAWAQPPAWKAAVSLTKPWVIGANFTVDQGEVSQLVPTISNA